MSKLPEGRSPLPQEWFIDRANNWGKISPMTDEERNRAKERKEANMNRDESDSIVLIAEMQRQNLTLSEAVEALKSAGNEKKFQADLDEAYKNNVNVIDDWDYWHEGDID
jgi:hypothetical protein